MEAISDVVQFKTANGLVFVVDAADFDEVCRHKWYASSSKSGRLYVHSRKTGRLHRWLMNAPDGMHVDHRNGNAFDNRRCNLRICTHAQNQWNRKRSPGRSRYKGVTFRKYASNEQCWMARVEKHGVRLFLGNFTTQLQAALAYDAAAVELFGEFAAPNFPERFK